MAEFVDLVGSFGPWGWFIAGLLLLVAELFLPGVFLMWVGIAAVILGVFSLILWPYGFWGWQLQAVLFASFSVISILVGRRLLRRREGTTDQPFLNQRTASLVGRTAVLREPIRDGRGRIHIDDTSWIVEGPDLPEGAHVKIVSGDGRNLRVEAVGDKS